MLLPTSASAATPVTVTSSPQDLGLVPGRAWVDFNGDGRADYCRVEGTAITDARLACTLSRDGGFGASVVSPNLDWGYDAGRAWPDVNGDHRADYCRIVNGSPDQVACTLSTGTAFGTTSTSEGLDRGLDPGRQWADFNGDGRADFCRAVGSSGDEHAACSLSNGRNPTGTVLSPVLDWGYDDGRAFVDVNGDKRADFCRVVGGPAPFYAVCTLSAGTSFGATISSPAIDPGTGADRWWVDVNGDRRADFCRLIGSAMACTLSTGTALGTTITSPPIDGGYAGTRTWADFDGNTTLDYCRLVGEDPANERVSCSLMSGGGVARTFMSDPLVWGYDNSRAWVDTTGDGKADYCRAVGDGTLTCTDFHPPAVTPPDHPTPQPPPTAPKSPTRIRSPFNYTWQLTAHWTRFTAFSIRGLPAHAKVWMSCAGGGCPFKRRTLTAHGRTLRLAAIRGHKLRPGARLEVRLTAPGRIGKDVRFTIRPKRQPKIRVLCVAPGGTRPHAC